MKKIISLAVVVVCLLAVAACSQPKVVTTKMHGNEYVVTTADKLRLYGWLTPSPHKNAPLFVLLPMMSNTHLSYNTFIKAVFNEYKTADSTRTIQALPHFLALDLRGHGESTIRDGKSISHKTMEPEDFAPYPGDVQAMIEKVLADKNLDIDPENIVIIGASIGANTSVMAAEKIPGVTKVVMLSPGENYRSLEPATALANFKGKTLILAGQEDAYSKTSCEKLARLKTSGCTLKIYPGPYHGTDLIDADPEAMKFVIDWLVR